MEMTPQRQQQIESHLSETRELMAGYAFALNDLVRFALSAAQDKRQRKLYHPMDHVNESARDWRAFSQKVSKLAADIEVTSRRLGVAPFDAEGPSSEDVGATRP